ncbi:MAG: GNAT family N-acetyltransferase [Anaerolineales bacterium]|nr:GNAT family N-acetyltransferase [Anaerolineales bacterium]
MTAPRLRPAGEADRPDLAAVLAEAGLSTQALLAPGSHYWAAEAEGLMVGVIGLELGAGAALLRSLAVRPAARGQGLGAALVAEALRWAEAQALRAAYLFSTDAGPFWRRQGFVEVPVPELVAALPEAPQVQHYAAHGWLPDEVAYRRALSSSAALGRPVTVRD